MQFNPISALVALARFGEQQQLPDLEFGLKLLLEVHGM